MKSGRPKGGVRGKMFSKCFVKNMFSPSGKKLKQMFPNGVQPPSKMAIWCNRGDPRGLGSSWMPSRRDVAS